MKSIKKRVNKTCSMCGKEINVIIYTGTTYRGGHFFGKVGLTTKKAEMEAHKAGTRLYNFHGTILRVMSKDSVPYKYVEDWECPKCYWP